jgi:hypothetical protein
MTRRDPLPHRAPVVPLRQPEAGSASDPGAVIVSIHDVGGSRVSTIRRGDGTVFTVTVPPGGIDTSPVGVDAAGPSVPWIREREGGRRAPVAGLDGLAARVGLHLVAVDPPPRPGA